MKKLMLFSVVVLVAVAALATTPARAVTLTAGENQAKFNDYSNLYAPGTTDVETGAYTPGVSRPLSGTAPAKGDENRAIFRVTSIENIDSGDFTFGVPGPEELTGMYYDLELLSVSAPDANGVITLDFGPMGRNPVPGAGTTYPATFGGVLEVYVDNSPEFTQDPGNVGRIDSLLPAAPPISTSDPGDGPTYWVEGQTTASRDSFTTATDGTLWLQTVFVDYATAGILGHTPGTVLSETINLTNGVGSGSAYAYITGGTAAPAFQRGLYGPFMDLQLQFDTATPSFDGALLHDVSNYDGKGYWQVNSHDPAGFGVNAIPEPATLSLLGMSLLSLGGLGLRRRKTK